MKLVEVWNAQKAWPALVALKKPSNQMSYQFAKYLKRFTEELAIIDAKKDELILALSPEEKSIKPDTPEMKQFADQFFPFLADTDCDLAPMSMSIDKVIEELDKVENNVLADVDWLALEPFFAVKEGEIVDFPQKANAE